MNDSLFEKHAEALFSLASEEGKIQDYETALQKVLGDFEREPLLESCLSSYALDRVEIYKIIDELYGAVPLKSFTPFLKVVANHHLMDHFERIEAAFRRLSNNALGIQEGFVFSALPLTEGQLELVQKTFEEKLGCHVLLTSRIDPALLGGIKVNIDGKIYDGTLANKLEGLRLRLLAQGGKQ